MGDFSCFLLLCDERGVIRGSFLFFWGLFNCRDIITTHSPWSGIPTTRSLSQLLPLFLCASTRIAAIAQGHFGFECGRHTCTCSGSIWSLQEVISSFLPIIMEINRMSPTFVPPPVNPFLSLYRTHFFSLPGICFFSDSVKIRNRKNGEDQQRS